MADGLVFSGAYGVLPTIASPVIKPQVSLLLLLCIAGCELVGWTDSEELSQLLCRDRFLCTDTTVYAARPERGEGHYRQYGFTIIARYENQTAQTLYLARCYPNSPHPTYGVELIGEQNEWGAAYSPIWACVGHENPIPVPAGGLRIDTLHLRGPNAFDGRTKEPFGVLEGQFRLVYEAQSCKKEVGCELPDSLARSNIFKVDIAR